MSHLLTPYGMSLVCMAVAVLSLDMTAHHLGTLLPPAAAAIADTLLGHGLMAGLQYYLAVSLGGGAHARELGALCALGGRALVMQANPAGLDQLTLLATAAAGAALALVMHQWLRMQALARTPADTAAQLAELQSRIRPHFLFNTLNSALALVRLDPQRAESVHRDRDLHGARACFWAVLALSSLAAGQAQTARACVDSAFDALAGVLMLSSQLIFSA
jgi:hypothetical protein